MRRVEKLFVVAFSISIGQIFGQTPLKLGAVPLVAEYEVIKRQRLADGNVLEKTEQGYYYRDSRGRTRVETGRFILLSDPEAGMHVVLDTEQKVARRIGREGIHAMRDKVQGVQIELNQFGGDQRPMTVRSLGMRVIEGLRCEGKELTTVIPPNSMLGNRHPVKIRVSMWVSSEVRLPILVLSDNPLSGRIVQRFKNIKRGDDPDPKLFQIPEGYKVVEIRPELQ